jgi:hypothetical protein
MVESFKRSGQRSAKKSGQLSAISFQPKAQKISGGHGPSFHSILTAFIGGLP